MAELTTFRWIGGHPTGVVLHHSGTDQDTFESIEKYHTTPIAQGGRGWRHVGYHIMIAADGSSEGGIPVAQQQGYHGNPYYNLRYMGVCCLGNFEVHKMPEAQQTALMGVMDMLKLTYPDIGPDQVVPHVQVNPKKVGSDSCPGKFFPMDSAKLRMA